MFLDAESKQRVTLVNFGGDEDLAMLIRTLSTTNNPLESEIYSQENSI